MTYRWLGITVSVLAISAGCGGNRHLFHRLGEGGAIGNGGGTGAGSGMPDSASGTGGDGAGGMGGSGGTSSKPQCTSGPTCNWCGGTVQLDSFGCVTGYRCANGIDPCYTSGCTTNAQCPTGQECGSDHLCWPGGRLGTGGGGGAIRTGGAGGQGGSPGTGGVLGNGGNGGSTSVFAGLRCGLIPSCSLGMSCCTDSATGSATCASLGAICPDGVQVFCDGPEDCSGVQRCCMGSGTMAKSSCLDDCGTSAVMCHIASDCLPGQICCATTSFGYSHGACVPGPTCS